jgi:hypothetical protein
MLSSLLRALPAKDLQHMQRPQRSSAVIHPAPARTFRKDAHYAPFYTPRERVTVWPESQALA